MFVLAGLALVPGVGIQNDEAKYASALLPPRGEEYALHVGRHAVPLMVMPYVGALKAALYRPMIRWFGTGMFATRVPMLLAGAASLWLWYLLLGRLAGERAALMVCGLLAADAMYLVTSCFDWGPVALQHLLLAGGLLLLVKFFQDGGEWLPAGGFFLFGLALWDKAVAVWMLSSLGIAALLLVRRQIRSVWSARRAGVALLALGLGAWPLIWYNLNTGGGTLHNTVQADTAGLPHKLLVLWLTANGSGLFGTMTNEDWQTPQPHAPRGWLQGASAAASARLGHPRQNLMPWAFALALLLAPLARGPSLRIILFALVTMVLAWWQMALMARAGDSVHHTILLWPCPQVVIGVSLAAASRRLGRAGIPVLATVLLTVMASGLAVINEYQAVMVRNGGLMDWTDASVPLSAYLQKTPAREVFTTDWGILDSLRLISRGRLNMGLGDDRIAKPELTAEDTAYLNKMISGPDYVFVAHVRGMEFAVGHDARLVNYARARGYAQQVLNVISDSYGRPTFEVYRFVRR